MVGGRAERCQPRHHDLRLSRRPGDVSKGERDLALLVALDLHRHPFLAQLRVPDEDGPLSDRPASSSASGAVPTLSPSMKTSAPAAVFDNSRPVAGVAGICGDLARPDCDGDLRRVRPSAGSGAALSATRRHFDLCRPRSCRCVVRRNRSPAVLGRRPGNSPGRCSRRRRSGRRRRTRSALQRARRSAAPACGSRA